MHLTPRISILRHLTSPCSCCVLFLFPPPPPSHSPFTRVTCDHHRHHHHQQQHHRSIVPLPSHHCQSSPRIIPAAPSQTLSKTAPSTSRSGVYGSLACLISRAFHLILLCAILSIQGTPHVLDCTCEHWLTPRSPDAWVFAGVPVGQCAGGACAFRFKQSLKPVTI